MYNECRCFEIAEKPVGAELAPRTCPFCSRFKKRSYRYIN